MKKAKYDFLEPSESVIMEGKANMQQGLGVNKGGSLILTDRRLVFKAHAFNFGSKLDEIPFSQIASSGKTLSIFVPTPNMIKVGTKDGNEYKFVVVRKQKDEWINKISEQIQSYNAGGKAKDTRSISSAPSVKSMASTTDKNCYLGVNGKKLGPLSEKDILDYYNQGKVTEDTKFIRTGMKEWITLSKAGILPEIPDIPDLPDSDELPELPDEFPSQKTKKRKSKKAIAFGLLISIILIGAGFAVPIIFSSNSNSVRPTPTPRPRRTTEQAVTWIEYENPEFDFVFSYPSDWELNERRQADVFEVVVAPRGGGAIFTVVVEDEDPWLMDYNDDEILEYVLSSLGFSFNEVDLYDFEIRRDVGSYYEQVWFSVGLVMDQGDFLLEYEGTNEDGYYHTILSVNLEQYDSYIKQIWDSFGYYYDEDDYTTDSYSTSDSDWLLYENPELDFVFSYPSDWELVENRGAESFAVVIMPRDANAWFTVSVVGEDPMLLDYGNQEIVWIVLHTVADIFGDYIFEAEHQSFDVERSADDYYEVVWFRLGLNTTLGDAQLEFEGVNVDGFLYSAYSLTLEQYDSIIDQIWESYGHYYSR